MTAYHILVSGWVQGVGFRWFAQRQAEEHGVAGWARNLPDGRVEVFAQGDEDAVEWFCERLREGPAFGTTERVEKRSVPVEPKLCGFQIRF